jgi:hypothetical protein
LRTYAVEASAASADGPGSAPGNGFNATAPRSAKQEWQRWLPLAFVLVVFTGVLLHAHTAAADIFRYAAYVAFAVVLPGTLVFRALRRTVHTLPEDLAFGAVVGLVLELAAWALFSVVGQIGLVRCWPLLVLVPFAAVPRLRRHWRATGCDPVPLGWSWSIAGLCTGAMVYLYAVFLRPNPIMPGSERTKQFIDMTYQMSLAGNAEHQFPLQLPQVAGEPLNYHWFAFVHLAMSSMVSGVGIPAVELRLMVPALVSLTLLIASAVGWRLSGRAWAGPLAAALLFAVGEFGADNPSSLPFGSPEVVVMVWASLSMTYSQPLLLALIGAIGDGLRRDPDNRVPPMGRGAFALVALFAFASSAAKASSLPVTLGGVLLAAVVCVARRRRIPWGILGVGAVVAAAQVLSTAVIFDFKSYGLQLDPLSGLSYIWADSGHGLTVRHIVVIVATVVAFLLYTQLRVIGIIPLMRSRRFRLTALDGFLIGGALTGPFIYVMLGSWNATYFAHAGLAFGVILSAWGYALLFERAGLGRRATTALAVGSAGCAVILTLLVYEYSDRISSKLSVLLGIHGRQYEVLLPVLVPATALTATALAAAVCWRIAAHRKPGLRGRGTLLLLTGALLAGAPALPVDAIRTLHLGSWGFSPMPRSRAQAALWVHDHSNPTDILATNSHCRSSDDYAHGLAGCNNGHSFWLSGYSGRSVLVEGWDFAPRLGTASAPFWDQALLRLNDDAVYRPTAALLAELHERYHVRYLVVDRKMAPEAQNLSSLASLRYSNGRIAVYELL